MPKKHTGFAAISQLKPLTTYIAHCCHLLIQETRYRINLLEEIVTFHKLIHGVVMPHRQLFPSFAIHKDFSFNFSSIDVISELTHFVHIYVTMTLFTSLMMVVTMDRPKTTISAIV